MFFDMENRPSTRLGNALGTAMRTAAFTFDYLLPLTAMSAYRLIPDARRGQAFGCPPASLGAVKALRLRRGGGWEIIRDIAVANHPPRPQLP
jgi:hypothetical protein